MAQPIQILFLATQTSHGPSGHQGRVIREIEDSISRSEKSKQLTFTSSWVSDFQDITRALLQNTPDIVHFSTGQCSETALLMLNQQGQEKHIEIEGLCELFQSITHKPTCVLFDVSNSLSLAKRIAQDGLFSVGMDGTISSDGAKSFGQGFYEYLGEHAFLDIQGAFDQGKTYMWSLPGKEKDVPVLFRDPLLDHVDQLMEQIRQDVHDSCLIPHLLQHSLIEHPEAVHTLEEGLLVNVDFSDLDQAFDQNQHRLLILGEAGSGKTIVLKDFVRKKARAWLKNTEGLFPIWLPLGEWKPSMPLYEWIQAQSGFNNRRFRQLWDARELLLILDSLDELPTHIPVKDSSSLERSNYQLAFVEAWNQDPFLAEIPCIISSRITDYELLTEKYQKNLIHLSGAVTLEPLRESAIEAYLQQAQIDGGSKLMQALKGDSKLLDLVRRPIFLEIVCDAYHDYDLMHSVSDNDRDLRIAVINRYLEKNYLALTHRPIGLETLTKAMGQAIFALMADFHSEDSYLPLSLITEQIAVKNQVPAYIEMAKELHLIDPLPHTSELFRFRHLLMRDYLVIGFAIDALKAIDPQHRIKGIVILGKLGNVHVMDDLSPLRNDPHEEVRYELAFTLGRIRTPQAKLILKGYLQDEHPDVRMAAVRSLSRYGDPGILDTLTRLIRDQHQDRFVRTEAIKAALDLSKQLPPEEQATLETLRDILYLLTDRDKIYEIREACKEALEKLGSPKHLPPSHFLYDQLRSQEYKNYPDELAQLWVMAVHLLTSFGFDYEEISQRPYLPISTKEIGDLLINSLIQALDHPTAPMARQLAAKALGKLGVEKAVDALNERMRKDEFSFVRIEAQSALKYIYLYPGVSTQTRVRIYQYMAAADLANEITEMKVAYTPDTDSLQENIRIFKDDSQNDYERFRAAIKIADLARAVDTRSAIKVLAYALNDLNPNVAAAAAISLGKIGIIDESQKENVINRLLQNLDNEDHVVRAQVCVALAKLSTEDSYNFDTIVEKLLDLWRNDPISDVRMRAEEGILHIYTRTQHPKAFQALRRLGKLPQNE
ncbi:MAG: HEAT repeat domain-containing protein [Bacteroidota bacterium]